MPPIPLGNRLFASVPNGEYPVIQPPRTWFASWKTHSKNPSENASGGSFSARTCYVLHGMLVVIHFFLIISYISRWEHHLTLAFTPTNTDFWPVVLSASLQAFYTVYTAVLVFLTQRLAMSRALVRHLKLTTIHDISSAWAGLGSALSSVWKQIDVPTSLWATTAVTTYLVCISVLHVTSSTLLQFQTFNSSMTTYVPTTLGWVDVSTFSNLGQWSVANWGAITASLPVISQFPGLVMAGLSNNTVYDTMQTSSMVGNATVNATTVTSNCGLLPNVTYIRNNDTADAQFGSGDYFYMTASPLWADQIQVLSSGAAMDGLQTSSQPSVLLMVSTLLDVEPSVQKEVAVPMTWESLSSNHSIEVYFIQCSLSTNNTEAVIDMQNNTLRNPMPTSQQSMQWEEMHQWSSTKWSRYVLTNSGGSRYQFVDATGYISEPSIVDEYIMSLVGLNLTAQYIQYASGAPAISNFTLSSDNLEAAIAQAVAQLTWMVGRMGSNGGIQTGEGMALVDEEVIALRLNVTLLPLVFATSASVIMLGLALHTTRAFDTSHDNRAIIPDTGALQLLWLGYHSQTVYEALEDVEHPTEANLRRAGMIDVCFAKTTSDEEELLDMGSSTDSPSVQAVARDRGDGM
ncbi:uncharacterized protein EDB91DRAFT_1246758 [Suillus paluster]|uniref:uncharacterized protein n=1 Tax=Suillus paluster TaxID=48578 RepID=UPI001B885B9D|nr:uncharacterized protein EDB91DRAFT_1246758 [Suillus paluster]KAG1744644.1 hypothetical protein EDB91DRAFT_1246758 [Suillus paluster]